MFSSHLHRIPIAAPSHPHHVSVNFSDLQGLLNGKTAAQGKQLE
jgi:hypothetical protein